MSDQISRRSIAKGTAWTVPAITVAAAAPASANSPDPVCGTPALDIMYKFYYYWGDPGSATQATQQTFEFSDLQFTATNLRPGVTITRVEWGMWMNLRYQGEPNPWKGEWRNTGIPFPDGRTDTRSTDPTTRDQACWSGACGWSNLTWGGATRNAQGIVTGGTSRLFRDGSTRAAWQFKETWTNTGKNFTATNNKTAQNPTGCGTFKTGRMGISNNSGGEVRGTTGLDSHWFFMSSNQTRWRDYGYEDDTYHQTIHGAIAYLSDGTTLTLDNAPAGNPSSWL